MSQADQPAGMEYKWRCSCGKRFRTPIRTVGFQRTCPKCEQTVEVPPFSSDRAIAIYCTCGAELEPLTLECPKCGENVIQAMRARPMPGEEAKGDAEA